MELAGLQNGLAKSEKMLMPNNKMLNQMSPKSTLTSLEMLITVMSNFKEIGSVDLKVFCKRTNAQYKLGETL